MASKAVEVATLIAVVDAVLEIYDGAPVCNIQPGPPKYVRVQTGDTVSDVVARIVPRIPDPVVSPDQTVEMYRDETVYDVGYYTLEADRVGATPFTVRRARDIGAAVRDVWEMLPRRAG